MKKVTKKWMALLMLLVMLLDAAPLPVLAEEPPKDNILLSGLDNLIVTPHIAWGSYNARSEIIRQMAEHIAELKKQN